MHQITAVSGTLCLQVCLPGMVFSKFFMWLILNLRASFSSDQPFSEGSSVYSIPIAHPPLVTLPSPFYFRALPCPHPELNISGHWCSLCLSVSCVDAKWVQPQWLLALWNFSTFTSSWHITGASKTFDSKKRKCGHMVDDYYGSNQPLSDCIWGLFHRKESMSDTINPIKYSCLGRRS